jgi:hypothetical protein
MRIFIKKKAEKQGSELSENIGQLKLESVDGKQRDMKPCRIVTV